MKQLSRLSDIVGLPFKRSARVLSEHERYGHHDLRPGTAEYEEHVQGELEHYEHIFREGEGRQTLLQPVPPSWHEVERRSQDVIRAKTGNDLTGHLVSLLNRRRGVRMLSLGCGPGGVELGVAPHAPDAEIVGLDISPGLLQLGRERATAEGLRVTFEQADLNTLKLSAADFDVVFCHAALHHVLELEHVVKQIHRTLRKNGVLITVDIVTRSGYRMWPENAEIVRAQWRVLPPMYRVNHTGYAEPKVDDDIWEVDTSLDSMECIRSEDILPTLERTLVCEQFVPYLALSRRFFDTMYGPNYDLERPLDRAIFDWIWELDRYHIERGSLRPETFFGIYRRG